MTQENTIITSITVRERTKKLLHQISQGLYERDEVIAMAFLTAIAGESIFMLGPPGVGKSMVARRLKHAFKDGRSFEYLMNRFSTPDEIFGPISISRLSKEDKYERITDSYLPGATVVFLDEIWKAGPSIQNALLTVINEKLYRNGEQEIEVKLQALVSASNELPEKGEGLEALWDRFLVRYFVDRILEEDKFFSMITMTETEAVELDENLCLTEEELKKWDYDINHIEVPHEVLKVISIIRKYIAGYNQNLESENDEVYVSDRRWRKIVRLLRASAFMNGREEVNLVDCLLISHCIWSNPSQIDQVKQWVRQAIYEFGWQSKYNLSVVEQQLQNLHDEIDVKTKEEKELFVNSPKIIERKYYQIASFDSSHDKILIDDFNLLSGTATDCKLYTASGRQEMYVLAKLSETEVEIRVGDHYKRYQLKTVREKKLGLVPKHITSDIIQELNVKADQIINYLNKVAEELEAIRSAHLSSDGNLFISKKRKAELEQYLNVLLKKVLDYKLDVQKMKEGYGGNLA